MRSKAWVAADGTCALMRPQQFRAMIALLLLAVAIADVLTTLPVGVLYIVAIGLTFWSTDRWMPSAVSLASAGLLMAGLVTSNRKALPIDYMVLMRLGGASMFLGAGWMIASRRRLLAEAHDRESMLRTIVDSEPACVKVLGPGCVLLDMNSAGLAMIEADSLEDVRGRSLLPVVTERDRDAVARLCDSVFAGATADIQYEIVGLKGRRRWLEMRAAPLRNAAGQVTAILGVTNDITERRRAEEQIRDSEQRLTQAAAIAGLGFFEHDHRTGSIFYSPGARAIFADGESQTITHEMIVAMTHPDDRERAIATIARSHDPRGDGSMTLESRIVRRGEIRHVSVKAQTRFDESGQLLKTVGTVFDVTERVLAEAQRDRLARRVLEIQEDERRAVARDLHDEIGQALSALKLNLLCLKRDGAGNDQVVGDSLQIADEVLQQVRDIALSLRPSVLDDLGLGAAVQWYVEQSGTRGGIRASCQVAPDLTQASPTTEIACFRVLQEALTNVHRHADATSAEVWLHDDGRELELVVRDNGRGFEVDRAISGSERGSNMGLLSIRERAALLGGVATVTSTPGVGSEVRVRFPLAVSTERLGVGVEV